MTFLGITLALIGQHIAYSFSARVRLLEKVELMINIISNEISFLSVPADELIRELSERSEISGLKFISDCKFSITSGMDFKSAWQSSLKKRENVKYLSKSDVSVLSSFADGFGITDGEGQISNCSLYLEFIRNNLNDAKLRREKYSAMSSGLGILSGIGIIVVLI